jgi:hypothetical protein
MPNDKIQDVGGQLAETVRPAGFSLSASASAAIAVLTVGVVFGIVALASAQDSRMTAARRAAVVEGVSAQLIQAYFDRPAAEKIAALVRQRLKAGSYDAQEDPAEFARLLTAHLREVNGDLHLSVRYSADPIPERRSPSEPTAAEVAARRERSASANFGFTEVRLFRANIGYIRFDGFHPYRWSEPTLTSTLAFLRGASALVLDLRYNTGGEADMVDKLNEVLLRRDPALTFILTSGATASAAEAVSHAMRDKNGATLVGERTMGAGNAGTMRRVDAYFEVFVPVFHTEWDGVGVTPHIEVAPEAAVERAQQIATERLADRAREPSDREGLRYLSEAARLRAGAILLAIRDAPFDASEARDVSGRYQYPNSVLGISVESERLIAQVEGRARRYSFTRRADGSYFAASDHVLMRFLRNEAGQVIALDWFEGGRSSPAHRIQ